MPATLPMLYASAKRLKRKQHIDQSDVNFGGDVLKDVVPYKGMNMVAFSFTVPGLTEFVTTSSGRKIGPIPHNEIIAFMDCTILDKEPDEKDRGDYFKKDYKGKTYWIKKIDANKQKALVRCSCKDFFMTWAYADFRSGNIWGRPPRKYIRKTPLPSQGGRPFSNEFLYPGFCKHVFYLWRNYMQGRYNPEMFV